MDKSLITQIKKDAEEVPFGNSQFQIEHLSCNQETPERKYRHVLLQMVQKISILEECKFRRKRLEIDIEEIQEKLKKAKGFKAKRLAVDLEEKELSLSNEIKLINDAVFELSKMVQIYQNLKLQLPDFNREKFEKAELGYYQTRFALEAQREFRSTGTITPQLIHSLENVGLELRKDDKGMIQVAPIEKLEHK